MKLEFGKYKGKRLSEVPITYLCHALEKRYFRNQKNGDELSEAAKERIRTHYGFADLASYQEALTQREQLRSELERLKRSQVQTEVMRELDELRRQLALGNSRFLLFQEKVLDMIYQYNPFPEIPIQGAK